MSGAQTQRDKPSGASASAFAPALFASSRWVAVLAILAAAATAEARKKTAAPVVAPPDAGSPDAAKPAAPPAQACAGQSTAEKTEAAPSDPNKVEGLETFGRSPDEQADLKDLSATIDAFEEQSKEYRKEIQLLVEKKYKDKRDMLGVSYEKAIADLEVVQRQERLDAIAQFEEFLSRYPTEPRYTPDVIYRLAELHYEKSQDEFADAEKQYEAQLKLVEAGKLAQAPPEPTVRFDKSVELYHRLLDQFPDYRYNDGTWYLLGYCLDKQGDMDNALTVYDTLIQRYPGSKFVPEAWIRVGEYYFDQSSDAAIKKSVDAYTHAIAFKDHPLYDKALYKLGWAYYRVDDFDNAVDTFLRLLDFYQTKSAASGEELGGDLRNEALQYTAISFADEKWGSVDKAKSWFSKIGARPYEAEIFHRLGDVFFDQTKQPDAIASYRMFLALAPTDKDAPTVQDRIIQSYERDRDFDKAFAEREVLIQSYGPNSAWAQANKHDPDVLNAATELSQKSLYSSAIFHHKQALAYKSDGKLDLAFKEFQVAAKGYNAYLERFPHSKEAYELTYYAAECLYNSLDFMSAAKRYVQVRDSNADDRYTLDSAESAVYSYQHEIESEQKAGKLAARPVIAASQRKEGEKVDPVPLPDVVKLYIKAIDDYVRLFPKCDKAPAFAHNAGVIYYTYNQFDEARNRFQMVASTYPDSMVSKQSAALIVESYLTSKDWKKVEDTSGSLAQNACKVDPKSETCVKLIQFKLYGRFKLADELSEKGQYDQAAAKYLELVDEVQAQAKAGNQDSIKEAAEFADKSLNNAAVCYEKAHRFDSALSVYQRLYTQYPQSPLADEALFRVGYDAQQSYDFDKAIERYSKLVKDYPTSKHRPDALHNEAQLLEGDQRYRESAKAFQSYAETFSDQEDAPVAAYHAATIYGRMKDPKGEIAALQEFQKKFSKNPKQAELIVEASKKIADAWIELGNERAAKQAFTDCVSEYKRRGMKPDNHVASGAAAESSFKLAEYEFDTFDRLKITGKGKALEQSFKTKQVYLKKAADAYNLVLPYKTIEWSLAAFYRKGSLLEHFAETVVDAPVPPDVKRLGEEAVAAYQDQLGQMAAGLEDKAVEAYAATLNEAKRAHVLNNEWIKKTLESLNRFRPSEYPLLKDPKQALQFDSIYPTQLADTPSGPSVPAGMDNPAPSSAPASSNGAPAAQGGSANAASAATSTAPRNTAATPTVSPASNKVSGDEK